MASMQPRTPRSPTPDLLALCRELVPGTSPIDLPFTPSPHAVAMECFDTVLARVAERGGSSCFGWQLWEWPGWFLEAEFHAVWRDPQGVLHDITPKPGPVERILFLPDATRRFEGRRVSNVRRVLSPEPVLAEFLRACDAEFELLNRGERAYLRTVTLEGTEVLELQEVRARKERLLQELVRARAVAR